MEGVNALENIVKLSLNLGGNDEPRNTCGKQANSVVRRESRMPGDSYRPPFRGEDYNTGEKTMNKQGKLIKENGLTKVVGGVEWTKRVLPDGNERQGYTWNCVGGCLHKCIGQCPTGR